MSPRATPFALVFAELARARFPALADALKAAGVSPADRDAFVLLEAVGRLLKELLPDDASPEALEAQVHLLHHVYRHWAAGGWVYGIGLPVLRQAARGGPLSSIPTRPALYLQLPEQRVWAELEPGAPPEPLDGMFATAGAAPGELSVLGVFGIRPGRAGFSVLGVEGHADAAAPDDDELEILARRDDGTPAFHPTLTGGEAAGLHSIANPGELLLLTCRLLSMLPRETGNEKREATSPSPTERIVEVTEVR